VQWRITIFTKIEKGVIGIGKNSGFDEEFLDSFGSYIIDFVTIFTEAIRKLHHSVVFLNELEIYHPDGLNILLQISKDRILNDGKDRTVVHLQKFCPYYDE